MKKELAIRIAQLNETIQLTEQDIAALKDTLRIQKETREALLRELVLYVSQEVE